MLELRQDALALFGVGRVVEQPGLLELVELAQAGRDRLGVPGVVLVLPLRRRGGERRLGGERAPAVAAPPKVAAGTVCGCGCTTNPRARRRPTNGTVNSTIGAATTAMISRPGRVSVVVEVDEAEHDARADGDDDRAG